MPGLLDGGLFLATLPFYTVTEVVLSVPTIATTVVGETISKIADPDHKWDATRHYKLVRDIYKKAAGVGLGVGTMFATGGGGAVLVLAGAVATNAASNMNQKCEKIIKGCSRLEKFNLRLGMILDGCGILGNVAKVGMDGFGLLPEILEPMKHTAANIGVPLGVYMKFKSDATRKYQTMSPVEQALEAAAMGISLYKFQELIEELSELY